jgi:membrane-associated protease RseP (regulator of RpoE activity)
VNGKRNEIKRRVVQALGTALVGGGLLLASVSPLNGQVGVASAACPDGAEPRGTIGISSFECQNCRLDNTGDERMWNFSSEPVVRAVRPGSPADGKIREGDEIVAIDGHLITTGEGGRRFANLEPGQEISVVVRSGNRERTVAMSAASECPRPGVHAAAPAAEVAPGRPAVPTAGAVVSSGVPRAAVAPRPAAAPSGGVVASVGPVPRPTYTLLPSGWFGFGIQCTNCRWSVEEETGLSEWNFSAPPEISSVQDGSPAAAAGLRRGDVLMEIDGESLVSREGGRRFGSVKPGETVQWTFQRGGETRTTTATAARRPDMPPPSAPVPGAEPTVSSGQLARAYAADGTSKLRYSGFVGETSVEVRGTGSVVVNIIEPGREIEIVTSDSRTRIKLDDSK